MALKISIVTVCFNSCKTIADTISCVNDQTYLDIEHIFVDGASTDSTVAIVNSRAKRLGVLISEKDAGIYDAMNKGISLAKGDVIGILNADDFYANSTILNKVAEIFRDSSVDACYGDLVYVKESNTKKTVRFWRSNDYEKGLFKTGWTPAHPTFFVRKSVYEKFGGFDLDYKIAADFEIMFRFIELHKIRVVYIPHVFVKMRLGGTTNKSIANILNQNREILLVLKNHYSDFSILRFVLSKIINRVSQFISRPTEGSTFK